MRGVLRFGNKDKLSHRFIGPFKILEQIGPVAYKLALPPSPSGVHDVFHESMLRKYMMDPIHVIDYEPLQLNEEKKTIRILAKEVKALRNREFRSLRCCGEIPTARRPRGSVRTKQEKNTSS